MRVKAVVADGNSNADLWAQQLKVVQDQLVDAHKQNAHALSETQQVWSKERHNFIAEAHKQRFSSLQPVALHVIRRRLIH